MWNLEVGEGKRIKLTFESFYIEPALCEFDYYSGYGYDWEYKDMSKKRAKHSKADCGECFYDYVSISYGSIEEKYCGSDLPGPIISSGNTMTVVFVSDSVYQFTGFKATWEAEDEEDWQECGSGPWENWKCQPGQTPYPPGHGQIQTPNYPGFYPASYNEVSRA